MISVSAEEARAAMCSKLAGRCLRRSNTLPADARSDERYGKSAFPRRR
jgi:hypothetical protein